MHPIAFYRKAKGWTQADLATRIAATVTTVQSWERGLGPRARTIPQLAELLGVDPHSFLREIEAWKGGTKDGQQE